MPLSYVFTVYTLLEWPYKFFFTVQYIKTTSTKEFRTNVKRNQIEIFYFRAMDIWFKYKMVTHNTLRTCNGKQVPFENKCQIYNNLWSKQMPRIDHITDFTPHVHTFLLSCHLIQVLYVQEVVTPQKNILIYLHRKIRITSFFNYKDILGWILFVYTAKKNKVTWIRLDKIVRFNILGWVTTSWTYSTYVWGWLGSSPRPTTSPGISPKHLSQNVYLSLNRLGVGFLKQFSKLNN